MTAFRRPLRRARAAVIVLAAGATLVPLTGGPAAAGAVPACSTATLRVTLGAADGAVGTAYSPLRFTNTGRAACSLRGFPGVSFVGAAGAQVGAPARRDSHLGQSDGRLRTVVLVPGRTAVATIAVAQEAFYEPGACRPRPVLGLRVYPAGSTRAAFVRFRRPTLECGTSVQAFRVGPTRR